ncbi:MAG: OmpA family protein [Geminicoccaceae bacterium]
MSKFEVRRAGLRAAAAGTLLSAVMMMSPGSGIAGELSKLITEIHFDAGSSHITIAGRQKVKEAIKAIEQQEPSEIRIFGFTDTTGDDAVNKTIAHHRATNVAALLVNQGVSIPMIVEGMGEHGAPYKIPDNVSEPLNRCVGIVAVGTSSGPASKKSPSM